MAVPVAQEIGRAGAPQLFSINDIFDHDSQLIYIAVKGLTSLITFIVPCSRVHGGLLCP